MAGNSLPSNCGYLTLVFRLLTLNFRVFPRSHLTSVVSASRKFIWMNSMASSVYNLHLFCAIDCVEIGPSLPGRARSRHLSFSQLRKKKRNFFIFPPLRLFRRLFISAIRHIQRCIACHSTHTLRCRRRWPDDCLLLLALAFPACRSFAAALCAHVGFKQRWWKKRVEKKAGCWQLWNSSCAEERKKIIFNFSFHLILFSYIIIDFVSDRMGRFHFNK